jgi:hypothetical protein
MQLLQFFDETRADQSTQKGNQLFSKILVGDHCAHRKNGLVRRNGQSFDGDRSPGDRVARVRPAGQAGLSLFDLAWRSRVRVRRDDAILNCESAR